MNKRLVSLALVLTAFAVPAVAADKVTPDQLKAVFAIGIPFTSTSPSGKAVTITLRSDGTGQLLAKGQTKGDSGKWRTTNVGYCSTWGNSTEHCYTLVKDGDAYTVMNASGGVAAHWKPPVAAPVKK